MNKMLSQAHFKTQQKGSFVTPVTPVWFSHLFVQFEGASDPQAAAFNEAMHSLVNLAYTSFTNQQNTVLPQHRFEPVSFHFQLLGWDEPDALLNTVRQYTPSDSLSVGINLQQEPLRIHKKSQVFFTDYKPDALFQLALDIPNRLCRIAMNRALFECAEEAALYAVNNLLVPVVTALILPAFQIKAVHSSMIQLSTDSGQDARGILFLGPGGVGKTTTALWSAFREGIKIINDDLTLVTTETTSQGSQVFGAPYQTTFKATDFTLHWLPQLEPYQLTPTVFGHKTHLDRMAMVEDGLASNQPVPIHSIFYLYSGLKPGCRMTPLPLTTCIQLLNDQSLLLFRQQPTDELLLELPLIQHLTHFHYDSVKAIIKYTQPYRLEYNQNDLPAVETLLRKHIDSPHRTKAYELAG